MDETPPDPPSVLPYETPQIPESLVRIRKYNSTMEAGLARLKLEDHGIRSNLAGETLAAGLGIYGNMQSQIELLVPQSDVAAAREILDAIEARRAARVALENESLRCPRCGEMNSRGFGANYVLISVALIAIAITMMSLGFAPGVALCIAAVGVYILVSSIWKRTCRKCGRNWTPAPAADLPDDDEEDEDE